MPKPPEIDTGFSVESKKVWALDLRAEEIRLSELSNNLDICYLEREGTDDWNLTLRELIKALDVHPAHAARVRNAEMNYPIVLYHFRGQWIILDGVHRYCQALLEQRDSILAVKVSDEVLQKVEKRRS